MRRIVNRLLGRDNTTIRINRKGDVKQTATTNGGITQVANGSGKVKQKAESKNGPITQVGGSSS
jgi:hypothetical protein